MRIQLACGTEDSNIVSVRAFHELLVRLSIPHDYFEIPGANHGDIPGKLSDDQALGVFVRSFSNLGGTEVGENIAALLHQQSDE